jgi:hypothetical protein
MAIAHLSAGTPLAAGVEVSLAPRPYAFGFAYFCFAFAPFTGT